MRSKNVVMTIAVAVLFLTFSVVYAVEKKSDNVKVQETSTTTTDAVKSTNPVKDQIAELQAKLEAMSKTSAVGRTGEQIKWQVISGGATNGSSTNYSLMGTVGQTAVGSGSSTNYGINHGYWQNFTSGAGCCNLPGDFNDDGSVDISDLTAMVDFMFGGGPAAVCADEADVNGDNGIDISDLTYRVDFMFGGGPAPICGTTGS